MTRIEKLLEAGRKVWQESYTHPFVLGIQNGDLPVEKFRFYIIQDYLYLLDYAKVFGIGITKCRSLAAMQLFASYIQAIIACELDVHNGYIGELNISREEMLATPVSLANRSYTSYMLTEAYAGGEAETLAAILSCALSYEEIAVNMTKVRPECVEHPFYGQWIQNYSGERYHNDNLQLIAMLEEMTVDYTDAQMDRLEEIFVTSTRYEEGFWEMSWNMSK